MVSVFIMEKTMDNNNLINRQDVNQLQKSPDIANKSNIAQKVGNYYNSSNISPSNRVLAENIFRLLVRDTEIKVRQVLADTLKDSNDLPHDIVNSIIKDSDSVALPFIQYYQSLTDEDLISILNSSNLPKQKAVAKRKSLSKNISSYIVNNCSDGVIEKLVTNETANIANETFEEIINKYPENDVLKKGIIYRNNLPFEVIEKIISHISYKLKAYLVLNHNLPQDFATDLINEIKEKLTLKVSEEYSQDDEIRDFVQHLYKANRLTYSLVTRAICSGDLTFFEHSLSFLAETPVANVRKILFNSTADFEIRNLFRKAMLPKSVFPAIFSALKVINDVRFDCGQSNNKLFSRKVIERILSYTPSTDELNSDDLNYLLSQLH